MIKWAGLLPANTDQKGSDANINANRWNATKQELRPELPHTFHRISEFSGTKLHHLKWEQVRPTYRTCLHICQNFPLPLNVLVEFVVLLWYLLRCWLRQANKINWWGIYPLRWLEGVSDKHVYCNFHSACRIFAWRYNNRPISLSVPHMRNAATTVLHSYEGSARDRSCSLVLCSQQGRNVCKKKTVPTMHGDNGGITRLAGKTSLSGAPRLLQPLWEFSKLPVLETVKPAGIPWTIRDAILYLAFYETCSHHKL